MQIWFTKKAIEDLKEGKVVTNKFKSYSAYRSPSGISEFCISDGKTSYRVTDNTMGEFVECIKL